MLYGEFLEGTKAVDNKATYAEYQRVEEIYMESSKMTKEDAYRMANVVTEAEHEKMMKKARKEEQAWVLQNVLSAAAFIRGMSEKAHALKHNYSYRSECGNVFELKLVKEINCGSVMLYEFWINGKKANLSGCPYTLLPSAEFSSYRARWFGKTRDEMVELFGYISWEE